MEGSALAPDGKSVAILASDHTLRIRSVPGGALLTEIRGKGTDVIRSFAYVADGAHLFVLTDNGTAQLWTSGGTFVAALPEAAPVERFAISTDGNRIITVSVKEVAVWDAAGKKLAAFTTPAAGELTGLLLSRNGKRLLLRYGQTKAFVYDAGLGLPMLQLKGLDLDPGY
ncbi:MAG: hypothetical protein EOO08_08800 [Chitinophagaceae bacterium]|nr:MAG: hypothetical protein EOO08_08800 [Chitinophagaceae bacterium]